MPFANSSQALTPLLDALWECANKNHAPFYTPGHKRGQGISRYLGDCFGLSVFRADLPELPQLDNLFAPQGVIQEAQQLAAAAFGAEHTWFLVNGSTCGVEAAILAGQCVALLLHNLTHLRQAHTTATEQKQAWRKPTRTGHG